MCLALFAILVLLIAPPKQTAEKHDAQKQEQSHQVLQPPPNSGDPNAVSETKFYTYSCPQESQGETAKIIFDGLLVAFTLGLVLVGWKQAKILNKQADILEKHEGWMKKHDANLVKLADAALLNAQAVINAQRPWVVICAVQEGSGFSIRAGNLGKTPAEVISFSAEQRCVDRIQELPSEPEFTQNYVPQIKLLVPGNNIGDSDLELMSSEEFLLLYENCRKESGFRQSPATVKMTVFYFRVLYVNVGGQLAPDDSPYESRICFCFRPAGAGGRLRLCGNNAYNHHE